jgi:predicted alpha/beta superfamily hydrolase
LFGAYILASRPEMFSHYLLVSGSYWYDDDYVIDLFQSGKAATPDALKKVWCGVGSYENQPGVHMMVDDQAALVDALLAADGDAISIEQRVFEDETHASIFPAAFSTGLRHLFSGD